MIEALTALVRGRNRHMMTDVSLCCVSGETIVCAGFALHRRLGQVYVVGMCLTTLSGQDSTDESQTSPTVAARYVADHRGASTLQCRQVSQVFVLEHLDSQASGKDRKTRRPKVGNIARTTPKFALSPLAFERLVDCRAYDGGHRRVHGQTAVPSEDRGTIHFPQPLNEGTKKSSGGLASPRNPCTYGKVTRSWLVLVSITASDRSTAAETSNESSSRAPLHLQSC